MTTSNSSGHLPAQVFLSVAGLAQRMRHNIAAVNSGRPVEKKLGTDDFVQISKMLKEAVDALLPPDVRQTALRLDADMAAYSKTGRDFDTAPDLLDRLSELEELPAYKAAMERVMTGMFEALDADAMIDRPMKRWRPKSDHLPIT